MTLAVGAIVGPTASGKSEMAVRVAADVGAEVVSCDSVQVYRMLDIGSGKISAQDRIASNGEPIRHHMLDVCDPRTEYTAYDYQRDARKVIEEIAGRGHIALLCGGTGLYFRSVVDDYRYEEEPHEDQRALRAKLEALLAENGPGALHALLRERDPEAAERCHPNNARRVLRALERAELGIARVEPAKPYYRAKAYGLQVDRDVLYPRIERRVEAMLQAGILEETQSLLSRGLDPRDKVMQALGYRHMAMVLNNELSLEEGIRLMKRDTRRYAKKQYTWFKKDPRIEWLPCNDEQEFEAARARIAQGLLAFFQK